MKSNYRKKLQYVQDFSETKDLTVSVKLSDKFIYFTYEEPKVKLELQQDHFMGIDLNPNYIGVCVKEGETILHTQCFDFKALSDKLLSESNSSESIRFKYLNNKLKHETLQTAKEISLLAAKYHTRFIFIEDLKNISKANLDKGHKLNRLTKNLWKRDYFIQNLTKRVNNFGMKVFKVNPMYTSVIGNVQHEFNDPINASLEVARRGYSVIILKNKQFYPEFSIKDSLKDLWKEHLNVSGSNWNKLFSEIKNLKLRYRVSLDEALVPFKVFQMNSIKSRVLVYKFN